MLKRLLTGLFAAVVAAGVVWAAEIGSLSTTDASNTARFPENMALSALNDAARALEGIIARWAKDTTDGCPTANGTNTITVSANRTISAYYDGLTQCFVISGANTGNVTVNVDSVGAYKLVTPNNAQLSSGDLQPNARLLAQWSEPLSAWQLLANPATAFSDPTTTRGDLITRGAAAIGRLAVGASNYLLSSNGTDPLWTTISSLLDSLGSTQGQVLYRGSSGWTVLATGVSGQVLSTGGASANPSWNTPSVAFVFESSTPMTAGNFTDFTSIPSSVTEIIVKFEGVTQDTANTTLQVVIGDSGGFETAGYTGFGLAVPGGSGNQAVTSNGSGFNITDATFYDASQALWGQVTITRIGTNLWSAQGTSGTSNSGVFLVAGSKQLTGTLDRLRIGTSAGTALFTAGTAYVSAR